MSQLALIFVVCLLYRKRRTRQASVFFELNPVDADLQGGGAPLLDRWPDFEPDEVDNQAEAHSPMTGHEDEYSFTPSNVSELDGPG